MVFKNSQVVNIVIYEATGRLQFYIPILVQFLLNKNGFNTNLFGVMFTFVQIMVLLAQVYCDKILKKFKSTVVLKYSTIFQTVSILLLLSNNNFFILIGMVLNAVLGPIRNQPLILLKNELTEDLTRSSFISTLSFFVLLLNSIILYVIGLIFESNKMLGLIVLSFVVLFGGTISLKNIVSSENKSFSMEVNK